MMYRKDMVASYSLGFALSIEQPINNSHGSVTVFKGLILLPHTSPSSFESLPKHVLCWSAQYQRPASLRGGMVSTELPGIL